MTNSHISIEKGTTNFGACTTTSHKDTKLLHSASNDYKGQCLGLKSTNKPFPLHVKSSE